MEDRALPAAVLAPLGFPASICGGVAMGVQFSSGESFAGRPVMDSQFDSQDVSREDREAGGTAAPKLRGPARCSDGRSVFQRSSAIYLLDTSAISALMRADSRMASWLASIGLDDRVVICTISRGEILLGLERLASGIRRTEVEKKIRDNDPIPRIGRVSLSLKAA